MVVAIVGATGLVGTEMLKVMEEFSFPADSILPVASSSSIGKEVKFNGKTYKVIGMDDAIAQKPDIAIFSAGGGISLEFAPKFAEAGTTVVDNSSAWRMNPDNKLIVPEINGDTLTAEDKIIANPNCSTIQMVLALKELHAKYRMKRIVVSTYQSVTGTGKDAVDQLMAERKGEEANMVYNYPIDMNAIPHIDVFLDNGYSKEEMKMVNETRKIFGDDSIRVTATTVRLPIMGGHAESVNVEFHETPTVEEARELIASTQGVVLQDDLSKNIYPMPLYAKDKNEVFVGRVRMDESQPNTLNLWVVADNLRKGAATNAVQIAEYLAENDLV
ncbi:MAG: aspartate-semialdehyde dehydrogenase [Bacteroidota bacterium]